MEHKFGVHTADEVVGQATKVVAHIRDKEIWAVMGSPTRGRMTAADVHRGEHLLANAKAARAASAGAAADVHADTHLVDDAETAATRWLQDQIIAVHGLAHESAATDAVAGFDTALAGGHAQSSTVARIRAFIALAADAGAADDTATRKLVRDSYADAKSRHAILKDGEHLAAALEAVVGSPAAARGERKAATGSKDESCAALARWINRWARVAHHHLSDDALAKLGLLGSRHHPAHRPKHVAGDAPAVPPPAPVGPTG